MCQIKTLPHNLTPETLHPKQVASQNTSQETLPRVLDHLKTWCGVDATTTLSDVTADTTTAVSDTTAPLQETDGAESDMSKDVTALGGNHPPFRREIDAAILQGFGGTV